MPKPLAYRPESHVQRSICEVLDLHGIIYSETDASRAFGKDGKVRRSKVRKDWPDISGVLPGGRAIYIECKTLTGRASAGQLAMLEKLRKQGAIAVIARSGHEVHELLNKLKQEGR